MAENPIASVALSLTSAVAWGGGDFAGGIACKKTSTFEVVAVAHGTGLVLMAVLALLRQEVFPGQHAMVWGGLAGFAGVVGLSALYKGLAVGKMGVVAPIAAVITGALPVIYGIRVQGLPKPIQLAGFALAAVAIVMISKPEKSAGVPKGAGLALLAGLGFGMFLVCINRAGTVSIFWPLVAARAVSLACMIVMVLATRNEGNIAPPRPWPTMLLAGALDSVGNALFVMAAQMGRLDVAAVLSSLYPASTVLLARFVLHEELNAVQTSGMVAALVAVPMIAG